MGIYVSELNKYPMKSGSRHSLKEAGITAMGIEGDRIFVIVEAEGPNKGRFISQRDRDAEFLATTKIGPVSIDEKIKIGFETINRYSFSTSKMPAEYTDVNVWGSQCKGIDVGDGIARIFSKHLEKPVRVVMYPPNAPRTVDPKYSQPGDITSYADGFPILVTSTPSLNSLREHFTAGAEIGMDRFRPNIALDGNLPWEEDVMHHIRIGKEVELEMVKPCARCLMTTIDQEEGERDYSSKPEEQEPLLTLRKIRFGGVKGDLLGMFFGQNAIPRKLGTIAVGDKVEILSTRPMHPAVEKTKLKFGM